MIRDSRAIIYSDSDGVIADFLAGAAKVLGHAWDSHHADHPSKDERGRILNRHETFWETLPPMPDWQVYWNFIKKYDPMILTAVPSWDHNFAEVEAGKREWYRRHIPSLPSNRILVVHRQDKQRYAMHGQVRNILIDDHAKNCQEFEAAGGIAILHHNAKSTIILLKSLGYH
jgi:5'(3')-deoxyribonucleotidase